MIPNFVLSNGKTHATGRSVWLGYVFVTVNIEHFEDKYIK